jgi:hypothetical protein
MGVRFFQQSEVVASPSIFWRLFDFLALCNTKDGRLLCARSVFIKPFSKKRDVMRLPEDLS